MNELSKQLKGRFLVFDGPDGSGKSTQIDRFSSWCTDRSVRIELVRDPGATDIGEAIREILLNPAHQEMTVRSEMLLYMASRSQLVRERIRPSLDRGDLVLADRFISSTLAYQGTAGGLSADEILAVGDVATDGIKPDLVVIFDVDAETSQSRLSGEKDRMELKGTEFHRRVRDGYLSQAARNHQGHLVIDASMNENQVFKSLIDGLQSRFASPATH